MYNVFHHWQISTSDSFHSRELVAGLQHVRVIARAEDLLLVALPLRLVDRIDPVLNFHDHTAVLFNNAWAAAVAMQTLRLFQRKSSWRRC